METDRIQRATSDDGTTIAGRVYGEGPPLVLVHGAMADGPIEWSELLPHLVDRFTCYLPDMRNRGLSDPHPDPSRAARVRDTVAFVESIGEPVALMGASGGGMTTLGATAASDMVRVAAAHEPIVFEAMDAATRTAYDNLLEQVVEYAERGDRMAVAETFFTWITNDAEFAAFSGDTDALAEVASFVPVDLAEFREAFRGQGQSPTAPETLRTIDVPALVTYGGATGQHWFADSARFAAERIPTATLRELDGLGHAAHLLDPERIASEVANFVSSTLAPTRIAG